MTNIILPQVSILNEINDSTNLMVEQNGEINRYPISDLDIGGGDVTINLDSNTGAGTAANINATTLGGYAANDYVRHDDNKFLFLKPKAGFIYPLAADTIPEGFLLCNGAEYSRIEYPELFTAIGTIYGVGDGSTTFNVPNLATRVPVGKGSGYALGAAGGEATIKIKQENLPGESIVFASSASEKTGSNYSTGTWAAHGTGWTAMPLNQSTLTSKESISNMQPYTVVNYIIATGKNTGVSVADIITGAQALPLGIEYGGTGATNAAAARENLGITPENIGAMSMELLWENASPKSEFVAQTISLNLGGYDGILVTMYTTLSNDYMSTPCFAFKKTKENQLIARDSGSIITRYFNYNDYSIAFQDCGQVKTYGSSPTVVNGYMIPCAIYGIKGVST